AKLVLIAIIVCLVLLVIVIGRIDACRTLRDEQKIEKLKEQITISDITANILSNNRDDVKREVENANKELRDVLRVDSNRRSNNFESVKQKW
ncbi:hypothetical protein OFN47_28275, partial [Escherichia coli]|nr:hypothetical protein [Escherichia coli]